MSHQDALNIITNVLRGLVPSLESSILGDQFLMKDLGLESIDLLNLLVDVERQVKMKIDLTELMRANSAHRSYTRDLTVDDLAHFLVESYK